MSSAGVSSGVPSVRPASGVPAASPSSAIAVASSSSGAPVAVDVAASSAAVLPAPPRAAPPADPAALLGASHADIATAWRELALRWNVAIGEGDACTAALQARLACFRSAGGGLGLVRQLERPAVLMLRGADGRIKHALLVALDDRQATLQVGAERVELPLPALAGLWRGEFATFWRLPPGWREGEVGASDPSARAWLESGLTAAGFGPGQPLAERVWAFQLAQGLPPDGRAGPLTVMRLNRLAGVDEPRLAGDR
jgi:general secretion pathway protein A